MNSMVGTLIGLIIALSSTTSSLNNDITASNPSNDTVPVTTATSPYEQVQNLAPDGQTSKEEYEKYLAKGIDITDSKYKMLGPNFELHNAQELPLLIQKIGLIPDSDEFKDEDGYVNWDLELNRGQYSMIINKFWKFYGVGGQPCCMGDTPDFSETPTTSPYRKDIEDAAMNGYYWTRAGSDGSKPFTMRELLKYLNKIPDDVQIPSDFYNNAYSEEDAYDYIYSFNKGIANESQPTKNMIIKTFKANILPHDQFYRLNLDKQLKLSELCDILVGAGDMIFIYRENTLNPQLCKECMLGGVNSLYERAIEEHIQKKDYDFDTIK